MSSQEAAVEIYTNGAIMAISKEQKVAIDERTEEEKAEEKK